MYTYYYYYYYYYYLLGGTASNGMNNLLGLGSDGVGEGDDVAPGIDSYIEVPTP